ncbi:(2Fe-2S)-binding protein [Pseudodesulfovibrio piezophilus]|uniref:Isoquinoline 1-oxidoreductase subunit alpha n=1 Tax=Pseudodesulfovibrio piezophilus (strain DSM 21447 / JCM 15486 / C1TLV30) TaxID=1322246 RepID=M1WVF9_PSEP2|nr:(2Fe-2S)-binding protein [Pseudodesulfovibrio piezophilus]CCH48403.1 Isoquinoline 1-oxidoreductase subunit alpha [Pseudodesulfovibrio piezophilus C1TLV30]
MISLHVNGKVHEVDVEPDTPLLWVLRDNLGITSVKYGCGEGICGICTVLIDDAAERSCSISVESAAGSKILTIEGLPEDHPVKVAWTEKQVPQCGYCQPGMMLQAVDILSKNTAISEKEMALAMDDFTCRCGSHPRVVPAMKQAAKSMKK